MVLSEAKQENMITVLAPGVNGKIRRTASFTDQQKAELITLLNDIFSKNLTEYLELKRQEGASFNPLSARIFEILYRESNIQDFDTIFEGLKFTDQQLSILTPVNTLNTNIALAFTLDKLRHLHLVNATNDQAKKIIAEAEDLILKYSGNSPLLPKIKLCIKRIVKKYD
jgi:hypothetical protein